MTDYARPGTAEEIAHIEGRLGNTVGPLTRFDRFDAGEVCFRSPAGHKVAVFYSRHDAMFYEHAGVDIRGLLDTIKALQAENAELRQRFTTTPHLMQHNPAADAPPPSWTIPAEFNSGVLINHPCAVCGRTTRSMTAAFDPAHAKSEWRCENHPFGTYPAAPSQGEENIQTPPPPPTGETKEE